jgi:hypothetical protein
MVGKKAFISCERKLSDDVLRYFHGCIDNIQSLGRKITMIYFQLLGKKAFESFTRKLYMMFLNIFMVGKKLFSLQTLMGKQLGTIEGPT